MLHSRRQSHISEMIDMRAPTPVDDIYTSGFDYYRADAVRDVATLAL